jgi:hypothetical protein
MNGLSEYIQPSGSHWTPPIDAMLHEHMQMVGSPTQNRYQQSVFDDFELQMARFEAEHEAQIAMVRKHYVCGTDPHLNGFMRTRRSLSQLLLEAVPHLRQHFGVGVVCNLRAPVDASGSQTLYAVVMWPGTANDVRTALSNFDNGWWFGIIRQASGNLTFTYELV